MNLAELVRDWTKNGASGELVLAHVGELARDDDVTILATAKFGKKTKPDPNALGRRFDRASRADAESRIGPQRYRLSLFHRDRSRAVDSQAFSLELSSRDELEGSGKSLVKESMRQNRRLHELVCRVTEGTAAIWAKTHHETMAEVQALREVISTQHMQMAKAVADLVDRKHERELETQALASSEARKDRVWSILENAAPVLLASASGSSVVADIFRSLDADKKNLLVSSLNDEQIEKLFEAVAADERARLGAANILGGLGKPALPAAAAPAAFSEPGK